MDLTLLALRSFSQLVRTLLQHRYEIYELKWVRHIVNSLVIPKFVSFELFSLRFFMVCTMWSHYCLIYDLLTSFTSWLGLGIEIFVIQYLYLSIYHLFSFFFFGSGKQSIICFITGFSILPILFKNFSLIVCSRGWCLLCDPLIEKLHNWLTF